METSRTDALVMNHLINGIEVFWVFLVLLGFLVASLALILSILLCKRRPSVAGDAHEVTVRVAHLPVVRRNCFTQTWLVVALMMHPSDVLLISLFLWTVIEVTSSLKIGFTVIRFHIFNMVITISGREISIPCVGLSAEGHPLRLRINSLVWTLLSFKYSWLSQEMVNCLHLPHT